MRATSPSDLTERGICEWRFEHTSVKGDRGGCAAKVEVHLDGHGHAREYAERVRVLGAGRHQLRDALRETQACPDRCCVVGGRALRKTCCVSEANAWE